MKKITLILSRALLILTGCVSTKRKNFLILIDPTLSISRTEMQRYITTIQETILPNMGEKDRLTIQFIDACSHYKAERIYSIDLAEMNFTNKADGANHAPDSVRIRLRRFVLETMNKDIANTIIAKRKERIGCSNYTDIINAINEVRSLVESQKNYTSKTDMLINNVQGDDSYEYETCLILFSDMVNENSSRTYDFTKFGQLRDQEIKNKVTALKEQNKIPDLARVKILVYGATSTKYVGIYAGKQIENVKLFWVLFFQSAGAEVRGYGYDTEIELKNYMASAR